ncbi:MULTISPECIES: hypothetical protein [Halorussus]|uniref:hypothetical protein n=1 Tax=Halorussus TaxID=1070314 RepID=UPI00209E40C6|nr:hypothetical protein [Halorussus vallis]USZ75075.1 hypothetical protein NGM07_16765 [Halorussus vallis]
MAFPTGLVPITAFVPTVGVAVPVTIGAQLSYRRGSSFGGALRAALAEAGLLYLVGVLVVWAMARGLTLGKAAAILVTGGIAAFVFLTALPLFVGRLFVERVGGVDSETALRYATYGWPVATVVAFGIFVAPGGLATNAFFDLGGERICLGGHCGIDARFAGAVVLELLVVLGPGVVGTTLCSSISASGGPRRL